ncbi:DUF3800 domain-containing protein [Sanguibacter sp. 4.1]|uniref:DUF3800 domain-containing protein n=1 Tax=Sanguibacter biliveldensis TaxID=3030830 RepID=A0AAF0Z7G9_9MICO|nr:DUF3800 domain-containing protein [Sanguibacter sp. 4.1]WPF82139.1 DUF3800 domain-containing protein [Sanguibacter sp. 4.1]
MLLGYVDESYTSSYFYLGALVISSGAQAKAIEDGLNRLVEEFRRSGAAPVAPDVELHGKEIFHGQDGWDGVPVRARIAIFRRAMKVVRESGARYVVRGMDSERHRARYATPFPPHEVVPAHLLESLDALAQDEDEHILVVADEIHSQDRHRSNFRDYRSWGTPGYKSRRLDRVRDTIHFAPSHYSCLLQAADLVTYLYRRRRTHSEPDARAQAATDTVWAEIQPAVAVASTWVP